MQNNYVHLVYFFMQVHLFYLYFLNNKGKSTKILRMVLYFYQQKVLFALKLFLNSNLKRSQNELSVPLLLSNFIFNIFVYNY